MDIRFIDRLGPWDSLRTSPVVLVVALAISYLIAKCTYQLLANPLRKFPGPFLASVTRLPYFYHLLKGDMVNWIQELHTMYGDVVRICPDELSYITSQAWKDIYGHATASKKTTTKDIRFYGPTFIGSPDIIRAHDSDHARMRRNFSHAFSDRALKEQQPLIGHYVDMLVEKLRMRINAQPDAAIDLVRMYNLTTFDIMGDLTFGDPLDLLKETGDLSWVSNVFKSIKLGALRRFARYYPFITPLLNLFMPKDLIAKAKAHYANCKARVDRRLEASSPRPDIWGLVLNQKENLKLSQNEMYANSQIFMVAGTETTATALSGLTHQLLMNPDKLEKIKKEVRETFKNSSEINMTTLAHMKYLHACIEEGLRLYPPVPIGLPRFVPAGGMTVDGQYLPENTIVSVHQWSAYRSPRNFKRPDEFIPERWMDNPEFESDNKLAFQPFSYGPRNCLGKNLAYHEMRIILAKVLYDFDLTLLPESIGWGQQKTFTLWEKNQLLVQLKPRN